MADPSRCDGGMSILPTVLPVATALGSAVAGGVYANFSARVMPRLAQLSVRDGVSAMQEFNRTALQAPFMTVFFGSAALSGWVLARSLRAPERGLPELLATGGSLCYLAGFVLTIAYNVPRNEALDRVDPRSPAAEPLWATYLQEWTTANSARAGLSLVGAALLVGSAVLAARPPAGLSAGS